MYSVHESVQAMLTRSIASQYDWKKNDTVVLFVGDNALGVRQR